MKQNDMDMDFDVGMMCEVRESIQNILVRLGHVQREREGLKAELRRLTK